MVTGYTIKLLPVVLTDLQEAKLWHERKRTGLGDEFKKAMNSEIENIKKAPKHFQKRYKELDFR